MKVFFSRLEVQICIGVSLILIAMALALFLSLSGQTRFALFEAADARQETSLRILVEAVKDQNPDAAVTRNGGLIAGYRTDTLPEVSDHALIDAVGAVSGETATVFAWDAAEGDFVRVSTNIVKPDGTRAVGTYLGKTNPVRDAMLRGDVYSGEAVILGDRYLTRYLPVLDTSNKPIGILYVGVARAEMDAVMHEMTFQAALKTIIGLIIAIVLTAFATRIMLKSLGRVDAALVDIREGDLDRSVPHTDRPDSIGSIARNVENLRTQLAEVARKEALVAQTRAVQDAAVRTLSEKMSGLAERDLTVRIPEDTQFPEGYEQLKSDFNTVADSLSNALSAIRSVSSNLHSASQDAGQLSGDLSTRVARQAATLEETAAAIEELTRSSQTINERVANADRLAASSVEVSDNSKQQLDQVVDEIRKIENSSQQIDAIVNLIEDIAFQTNLLALNAGVEAARAGDSGRGFAVVASEVRGLAQRASDSVGEIRALTKANIAQVKEGSKMVQSTGESIRGVLEQIQELGQHVSDVTAEIENQTQGLTEINAGMRDLDRATQENAALASDSEASSDRLNAEANQLAETISAFRFDPRGHPGTAEIPFAA